MKFSSKLSCFAAALALACAGCASVNTVQPAYPQAQPDKVPDKRIITNSTLNEIAYVVEVDHAKTKDGFQIVQVQLQNKKVGVKNVNYRFTWYDANGIALDTDSQIKSLSLEGGETREIQDVATSPNAVDWKLSIYENASYPSDANNSPSKIGRP